MTYDLIIIGGGPAGYLAAERAAEGGLSVLLFEKKALGGVCLNEGCIPTKTLLHSSKLYTQAQNGEAFGVSSDGVKFNHQAVIKRKTKIVRTLVAGVSAKMKGAGVTVVAHTAEIIGGTAGDFSVSADGATYSGRNILVATGSEVLILPIPGLKEGLESGLILTSREILDLAEPPKTLAVIGGGVIGLEMAAYFAAIGVSVTVIEMQSHIGGYLDTEIADMLQKELAAKGIKFMLNTKIEHIDEINADKILLAIGRKPVSAGFGLESLNVHMERGAVVTDTNSRTNVPGIYAAGDVNGKSMLAHTAYREAEVAINHILGVKDEMRYDAIPAVIYTSPEVAGVGETEESAAAKGIDTTVKKLSMRYSGRFVAETDRADGLCKLIMEKSTNRLIGAHIIGNYASEIVQICVMMIESRRNVDYYKQVVFPHPTVCEIIREVLFS
ncbi:MAG: dihydrolipoyl dehydrogenase [Defluviitaleaceae bacterium]|nr:dihydrolipoyl dehydrogenase [Defluviitaleaceae bacterium]